jgi:medium-chain acyl-[acyl-carrier-protein] hydrolase
MSPESPPTTDHHTKNLHQIVKVLSDMGGTPPALLQNKEFMEMMLPTILADFKIHETYTYTPLKEGPFRFPITVIRGEKDNDDVTPETTSGWNNHTTGFQDIVITGGNHFHIFEKGEEFSAVVNKEIARLLC